MQLTGAAPLVVWLPVVARSAHYEYYGVGILLVLRALYPFRAGVGSCSFPYDTCSAVCLGGPIPVAGSLDPLTRPRPTSQTNSSKSGARRSGPHVLASRQRPARLLIGPTDLHA